MPNATSDDGVHFLVVCEVILCLIRMININCGFFTYKYDSRLIYSLQFFTILWVGVSHSFQNDC